MSVSLRRYRITFYAHTKFNLINRPSRASILEQATVVDMTQSTTNWTAANGYGMGDFEHMEVQENTLGISSFLIKWERDDNNPEKSLALFDSDYCKIEIEGGAKPVYYFVPIIRRVNPGMVHVSVVPDWLTTLGFPIQVNGHIARHHVSNDTPFTEWTQEPFANIEPTIVDIEFYNTAFNHTHQSWEWTENYDVNHIIFSQADLLDADLIGKAETFIDEDGFNSVATPIISPVTDPTDLTLRLAGPSPNYYTRELPLVKAYEHKIGMQNDLYKRWIRTIRETGNDFLITSSYTVPVNFIDQTLLGNPEFSDLRNTYRTFQARTAVCGNLQSQEMTNMNILTRVRNLKTYYYYVKYSLTNLGSGDSQQYPISDIWSSAGRWLNPNRRNFLDQGIDFSVFALLSPTGSVYMRPTQLATIVGEGAGHNTANNTTIIHNRNNYLVGIVKGLPWISEALGMMGSTQTAQAIASNAFAQARVGNQTRQVLSDYQYGSESIANSNSYLSNQYSLDRENIDFNKINDLNMAVNSYNTGQAGRDYSNEISQLNLGYQRTQQDLQRLSTNIENWNASTLAHVEGLLNLKIGEVMSAFGDMQSAFNNTVVGKGMAGGAPVTNRAEDTFGISAWANSTVRNNAYSMKGMQAQTSHMSAQHNALVANNTRLQSLASAQLGFTTTGIATNATYNADSVTARFNYASNQNDIDLSALGRDRDIALGALGIASAESTMGKNMALYLNPYNVNFTPDIGLNQIIQYVYMLNIEHLSGLDMLRLDRFFDWYGYGANDYIDELVLDTPTQITTTPTKECCNSRRNFNYVQMRDIAMNALIINLPNLGTNGYNTNSIKSQIAQDLLRGVRFWHKIPDADDEATNTIVIPSTKPDSGIPWTG